MALTDEKIEMLSQYLIDDKERAEKLFDLSPEDVADILVKDNIDITVEDVIEYGEKLKAVSSKNEELDASDLDDVAGGVVFAAGAAFTCVAVAYVARKYRW